ncbi:sugar ABC transporter substrate-binding protein [Bacillus sp. OTU530]|uniref:sugar ABC transporter substrate-binding protein n=1 Tax=Bacillus sp. OTU530 TaxID=3043862 RepID=UPI00313E11D0
MKRKWIILLIITVLLITCIVKFLRADDRPKVIVVLQDLDSQYSNIMKVGAEKGFREFDIDGKVIAPPYGSTADVQAAMINNILKEHPDILVVSPFESPVVLSNLKKAVETKTPVVLLDTDVPLKNRTIHIGADNFELGRIAGELLASQLQPKDEVVLIAGDLTSTVLNKRIQGATFSLETAGIKIVEKLVELPFRPLDVKEEMTRILQQYPNIKGVFAINDVMALNALEVIKKHGNKVPVVGTDGITKMVESIEDGTIPSTVAQNPYDMGYISVETAWEVIKGERVRKNIDTGVDIITKDNAKLKLDFLKEVLK